MYMLNNINNYILLILINTMGRGAAAAHAAYNGSGTQGISVTNEINENEDIHSVFITQNDTSKQILHGHNISAMTCAGKSENITSETYKIFTPNENVDMLGDIYLNFEMDSEITNFEFVDKAQSNSRYNLQQLSQDSLITSFTAAGDELKHMELDLTTREVPPLESLTLSMRTVNKIKTFKTPSFTFQVAVGRDDYNKNVAWRHLGTSPNEYGDWNYTNISQFVEVNDVIYDPNFKGTSSFTSGALIFGGYLQKDFIGTRSGLYLIDVTQMSQGTPSVQELALKAAGETVLLEAGVQNNDADNPYTFYITVNTLNYRPGSGFIVSGKKDGEPNINTSLIFKNSSTSSLKYTFIDIKFDLIYDDFYFPGKDIDSEREVSSILSINDNGTQKTLLSCGTRYNTMLGLDTSGLIIRSYDNGETWEHIDFYYGRWDAGMNEDRDELQNPYTRTTAAVKTGGDPADYDLGSIQLGSDPFKYFMPKVSQLHTNKSGIWTAIGQQGIQPNVGTAENDKYRQFVFRSTDDGETWSPLLLQTWADNRELDLVQFNSVLVDYITIYSTDEEDCKVLMSIPKKTIMVVRGEADGGSLEAHTSIGDDGNSYAMTYNNESYVLHTIVSRPIDPSVLPIAVLTEYSLSTSGVKASHMITPYYLDTGVTSISDTYFGRYDLTDLWNPTEGNATLDDIKYNFLGAISDGNRDILFGRNKETTDNFCGIVTLTSRNTGVEQQWNHTKDPMKTITIKLGTDRIIQNMVYTKLGITAILEDSSNSSKIKYEIFQSSNGIKWKTLKVMEDLDSAGSIFIKSDLNSTVIYSYKSETNGKYKIFKITHEDNDLEIDSLQNELDDIKGLNYVCTEWIITGVSNTNNVLVKSYDTVKWRVVGSSFSDISSIVVKDERLYEPLVMLDEKDEDTANGFNKAKNYKIGNFKSYEVCHSASVWPGKGGGILAYVLPDVSVSHSDHGREGEASGKIAFPDGKLIQINSLDGSGTFHPEGKSTSTNVNDIIQITDGTVILCGENKPLFFDEYIIDYTDNYTGFLPHSFIRYNNKNDFINLAEGPGNDGLTFVEASSIYKPSGGGTSRVGMTKLAKTFYSLHETKFLENYCLAIGKNWYGNGVPDGSRGSIEDMNIASDTDGLLALRYIPDPNEFTGLTQTYYWKFIFGTNDQTIKDRTVDTWTITPFNTIHDVYTNDKREIVVVGNPKNGRSPIFYENPDNKTFKTFRNEWYEIPVEYHGFSEVLSVCYTGTRWIFAGIPTPKWVDVNGNEVAEAEATENVNDGKILAHTTDLLDPDTWVIENFADTKLKPFNIVKETDNTTLKSNIDSQESIDNVSKWQGNHVRPVNYKEKSCVIINVSFYDDTSGIQTYDRLQEKVYFMHEDGSTINIYQNDSFPEPTLIYRKELNSAEGVQYWNTTEHGGEQFRPTWETYINNEIRTLFNTVYKHSFNQYVVDYNNVKGEFFLNLYNHPFSIDYEGWGVDKPWVNRYRKFITTDTFSLRNRIEGNCYKIEQVKNENFITGVDSVRYLAVGKGISSPIVKSDDLINWTDVDVKDIFTVVFDISHKSGLWVAVGEGNYNLAISKDGKNWTGIYTKYQSDTLSSDYSAGFNSLDYHNNEDNNVIDILPYVPELKGIFLKNLSLLRLFSRIEYHVGTQIWQTLTFDDIKAMLDTEFGSGEYRNLSKNCSIINEKGSTRFTTWIPGFTKTLNSKLETFVNVSENGSFPNGLLKEQKLSIKIYYNKLENILGQELISNDMNNSVFDNLMNNTLIPTDRNANYYIDSFLADNYGFQLGDTYKNVNGHFVLNYNTIIKNFRLYSKNFELDDIEINKFNKGVKQTPKITQSLYFDANNTSNLILDLDSFDLYASHIIVSGWLTSDVYIKNMDLELNGYSYQKIMEPSIIDFSTKSYLGLNYNKFIFNGIDKEDGIGSLVIPLASTAYSGSSVPLDRYNSIRLKIVFNTIAGPYSYINVTCVGTTTVSYNNNTANIDLY